MPDARFTPPAADELEVSVFGPSKGECIVVHVPSGPWFVVDSFNVKGAAGAVPVAVAYLRDKLRVSNVYGLFLTHWHDDHTHGAAEVIDAFASSLKLVGLPDGFGKREFASYMAGYAIPDDLRVRAVRDLLAVFSALERPGAKGIERVPLATRVRLSPAEASWGLEALSPSLDDQRHHMQTLLQFLPDYAGPKPSTFDVNSGCAVLRLEADETVVMLCSDLDRGEDDGRGWRCLVKHRGQELAASVVKVGHHGSDTAYLEKAWKHFGRIAKPRGVVTPFPARGEAGALPREDMRKTLRKHCTTLHHTGAERDTVRKAGAADLRHTPFSSYTPKTGRTIEQTGQVRYRKRAEECTLRTEVFAPAHKI